MRGAKKKGCSVVNATEWQRREGAAVEYGGFAGDALMG
jgi:hypothetical protein